MSLSLNHTSINLHNPSKIPPSKPQNHPPAKRLINTKDIDHKEWLKVRQQGIGSSDAAAACGINPYLSMLELWLIKTGRKAQVIDDGIADGKNPLYWGKKLEPVVASFYHQKTGNKVRRVNAVLRHADDDKSFMLANLDYAIVGNQSDAEILEIKTVGQYGAKLWQDGVPLYVICQVQHQLAVTGKQLAHVCVLICGHETRIYQIKRDDALIDKIIQAEQQFWQYVELDIPPPADYSQSCADAINFLYPKSKPLTTIDFSQEQNKNDLFDKLVNAKNILEDAQKSFDMIKHEMQISMADNELAIFNKGSIYWKSTKDSTVLDTKALLKDKPNLINDYGTTRSGSRRFVIKES